MSTAHPFPALPRPVDRTRRRLLLAAGALPLLSACGGGGGDAGMPDPRDTYTPAANPFTASQHSATLARDGSVLLLGGSRGEPTLSAGIDRFDPAAGTFRRIGELAHGRGGHRATAVAAGILVTGGLRSSGDGRVAELVDEATGAARAAGSMSVVRIDHGAVRLADGRLLVAGGFSSGERAALGISDSAEIWDPATQSFRRLATGLGMARAAHSMTLLPDGRVLVAGGYHRGGDYTFAEVFDPATESFTRAAIDAPLRANHAAHLASDGRVWILGGETLGADGQQIVPLASALACTPSGSAPLPDLAAPRTWCASVALPSGDVLLFGGQRDMTGYTETAERYSRIGGGVMVRNLDAPRALHTATLLADGRVLVAGGEGFGGSYRSTALVYRP